MTSYAIRRRARSQTLPVRLHRYHTWQWGNPHGQKPPLVLLHGWMDVGASFQFMVDAFDDHFLTDRLIVAPDWRGFGHTHGPDGDHFAFVDYLGDLELLLDQIAGQHAVDLLGHSMGGNVAMMYAGTRPERLRRLINLEGFGLPATQPGEAPARYARWLREIKQLNAGSMRLRDYSDAQAVAARLIKTNPRLPADKADWLARRWAEPYTLEDGQIRWRILGSNAHRVISAQLFRLEEMLALYANITTPTLMVEASDGEFPAFWKDKFTHQEFRERLSHVGNVQTVTVDQAGHMLHHDQPERLAELVTDFLTA